MFVNEIQYSGYAITGFLILQNISLCKHSCTIGTVLLMNLLVLIDIVI